MSAGQFQRRLHGAKYAGNDVKYFPLWVRRYAQSVTPENGRLPVSVELVKEFSRSLLQSGTPAWQRLQAVRAVEAYRDLALCTEAPSLFPKKHAQVPGLLLPSFDRRQRATVYKPAHGSVYRLLQNRCPRPHPTLWSGVSTGSRPRAERGRFLLDFEEVEVHESADFLGGEIEEREPVSHEMR